MAQRKPKPAVLVAAGVLHLVVTGVAWRDLSRRSPAQVRGNKKVWRVFCALNMGNSLIYFLVGRKRTVATG